MGGMSDLSRQARTNEFEPCHGSGAFSVRPLSEFTLQCGETRATTALHLDSSKVNVPKINFSGNVVTGLEPATEVYLGDFGVFQKARVECILVSMTLSARNRLEGKIIELQLGGVMAHVVVKVGENLIESVITRRSAEEMKLKVGDTVSAIIKSTEVMLEKP